MPDLIRVAPQEVQGLAHRIGLGLDLDAQVGAVEAAHEFVGGLKAQRGGDVLPDALRGGGGQGQAHGARELVAHGRQLAVLRPEVVAPFRDAMRLVDRQAVQIGGFQQTERARHQQRFRRDVQQLDLAAAHAGHVLLVLLGRQGAVEEQRRHAQRVELLHLVLHQGDQGRDDDGQAGEDQGRELVAQRLAAPGRHDHQRILPGEDVGDDFALQGPEFIVTKHGLEGGFGWWGGHE